MFDIGRLKETIGGLLSGNACTATDASGITGVLAQAGIDPAMLNGLGQQEILALLQQHGINPSQLDPDQLAELVHSADIGGHLADVAQSWLRSRGT